MDGVEGFKSESVFMENTVIFQVLSSFCSLLLFFLVKTRRHLLPSNVIFSFYFILYKLKVLAIGLSSC